MSLIDIDDAAARQRMREIVAANKAALDARVRKAAELAGQAREAFEREEAELKAALERKEAAQPATEAGKKPEPPRPNRTLKLGAPQDREEESGTPAKPRTERPRPSRPEVDDDLSGRTWLR